MKSLAIYVPMDRRQALARGEPLLDRTRGAALSIDMAGFVRLAETLEQELGLRRGAEELAYQLERVSNTLITEVHRYSGSVIGFSSDVVTCWFDGDNGQRATACALVLQQVMTPFEAMATPAGTIVPFKIKIAVTAGPARRFQVGYPRIQTMEVLAGETLDRLAVAEQQLHASEVIVDADIASQLEDNVQIRDRRTDAHGEQFAVVTGLNHTVPPTPWPDTFELSSDLARDWLLPPIFQRLQRGEEEILAELRLATVLFLRFNGIDYDRDDEAGQKLDVYIRWVQTVLARYESYVLQLGVSRTGSYFYTAFGVPLAHEDDPVRAIAAALELQSPPPHLNYIRDVQMGISQGQVRAGTYGGKTRRIYGVLGHEINITARLMLQAKPGQILVTRRIVKVAGANYDFQELGSISLPDSTELMPVFVAQAKHPHRTLDFLKGRPLAPMVGRAPQRAILSEHLQALLNGYQANIVIEGVAGIGKSRLIAEMLEQARILGIPSLVGSGDAIEQITPYQAWRPIFRELFKVNEMADASAVQEQVLGQLADDPELLERAPLLNTVLPLLNLPDNDLTAQMSGDVRANNTRDLLVRVLAKAQRAVSTLLLVLEDAHWLDSASWSLILPVSQQLQNILVVIGTRPMDDPLPEVFNQILHLPDTLHLKLETLPIEDSLALVCQRLGISELPAEISELIREKAEGHPFFSEELAYALRDAGLIIIRDGLCTLSPEVEDWHNLDFPNTIQGVITSRIDRLSPGQQLTLKVASIIGRVFVSSILRDIHPVEVDRLHLDDYFKALERLDIILPEATEPEVSYLFKHIMTQEVTYNMIPFSQQQAWHRAVAEWYEHKYANDLSPHYALLSHHWYKANVQPKAIEYLGKAGEQALLSGAYQEAVSFLGDMLSLVASAKDQLTPLERAHWLRLLGEGYYGLGDLEQSREYLEEAVALLGKPMAHTFGRLATKLAGQMLRQTLHRLWPAKFVGRATANRPRFHEAARTYKLLSEIYLLANDTLPTLYAAIRTLNFAERIGPCPELAQAYGDMALGSVLMRLKFMAETYRRMAEDVASQVNQPRISAYVWLSTSVYTLGEGKWTETLNLATKANEIHRRLGNWNRLGIGLSTLAHLHFYLGEFQRGGELNEELVNLTQRSGSVQHLIWGLEGQAESLLRLDGSNYETEVMALLKRAQSLFADNPDRTQEMYLYENMAVAHLRLGQFEAARQAADVASRMNMQSSSPTLSALLEFYSGLAYTYLTLWETSTNALPTERKELAELAWEACQNFRRYAKMFVIGRPRAALWQGLYHWLAGKSMRAYKNWQKSLAAAQKLNMPFDEGLAYYEIGRHLERTDPVRRECLSRACDIFTRLGTTYDLARAQAALDYQRALPNPVNEPI